MYNIRHIQVNKGAVIYFSLRYLNNESLSKSKKLVK